MELALGHPVHPKPRAYSEIVNPKQPDKPRRLQIVADTAIRGVLIYTGSVIEVDVLTHEGAETDQLLRGSLKAIRVPLETPLHDAPATKPPVGPSGTYQPVDMTALAAEMIRQLQHVPNQRETKGTRA